MGDGALVAVRARTIWRRAISANRVRALAGTRGPSRPRILSTYERLTLPVLVLSTPIQPRKPSRRAWPDAPGRRGHQPPRGS